MENSAGITASLQGRYASALFDLASEKGFVTVVEGDLDALGQAVVASPELGSLIRSPKVSSADAAKAIAAVAQVMRLSEVTTNFLGVLAQNGRLSALPDIVRAFAAIAAAQRGEVTAEVTSAHALTDEQVSALAETLKAREGKQVKIKATVDPALLGGLVVRIGSKQIDGSIRTRLNSLALQMRG